MSSPDSSMPKTINTLYPSNTKRVQLIILSLFLSFAIVFFISSNFNFIIGVSIILLSILFYIILSSLGTTNNSIPYALQ